MAFAQEEARLLAHSYVGTEHLLLGLLDESSSPAGHILSDFGVTRHRAWNSVIDVVGRGRQTPMGFVLLTPRARTVLATAADYRMSQVPPKKIMALDILVGLVEDPTSIALKVLTSLEVDTTRLRVQVEQATGSAHVVPHQPQKPPVRACCPRCQAVLAKALTTTTIADGDVLIMVTYCGGCGWTLGASPVDH